VFEIGQYLLASRLPAIDLQNTLPKLLFDPFLNRSFITSHGRYTNQVLKVGNPLFPSVVDLMEDALQPVVGALDIDVAGDAPAVAELASYDPINAMRHVGLVPEDFTVGEVSGNVKADIPLRAGFPIEQLKWQVALDYTGLALAREVEGQPRPSVAGDAAR
jgi:hypothetical protein